VVIGGIGSDEIAIGRDVLNEGPDATHRHVVIGDSGAVTPTVEAHAVAWGDAGNALADVGQAGPDGRERLALFETWEPDTRLVGEDRILLGDGEAFVLGGGGDDLIDVGSGPAAVFGDTGEITFATDDPGFTERTLSRIWQARDLAAREAAAPAGDDAITLGAGALHLLMGGGGSDRVWTQHATDFSDPEAPVRTRIAADPGNRTYLAGDRAILRLDPELPGAAGLADVAMLRFDPADEPPHPDMAHDDTAILGDGRLWAVLGAGSDTLTHGDGDAYVLGDFGTMRTDPSTYGIVELRAAATGLAVHGGDDTWKSGHGRHAGVLGRGDDTVGLGDGDVFALLDHGRIDWTPEGRLDRMEDLDVGLAGDDVLVAGSGEGVVIGGGGDDTIWTGREMAEDALPRDNRDHRFSASSGTHILFGDLATADFDPELAEVAPVRLVTREIGFGGRDDLRGGAGDDIILGGGGRDRIHGDAGRGVLIGDYAEITFRAGLLEEVISSEGSFGEGAGDTILTGHAPRAGVAETFDGALVMGGTMANTFRVALARDIVLETYGRFRFQTDRAIALQDPDAGYAGWAADLALRAVENFGGTENRFDRETRDAYEADGALAVPLLPADTVILGSEQADLRASGAVAETGALTLDVVAPYLRADSPEVPADAPTVREDIPVPDPAAQQPGATPQPADAPEVPPGDEQSFDAPAGDGSDERGDGLLRFAALRSGSAGEHAAAMPADDGLSVYDTMAAGVGVFGLARMTRGSAVRAGGLDSRLRRWDGTRFVLRGETAGAAGHSRTTRASRDFQNTGTEAS
jgi:Ca2+-binding RTX toxin-like protein